MSKRKGETSHLSERELIEAMQDSSVKEQRPEEELPPEGGKKGHPFNRIPKRRRAGEGELKAYVFKTKTNRVRVDIDEIGVSFLLDSSGHWSV